MKTNAQNVQEQKQDTEPESKTDAVAAQAEPQTQEISIPTVDGLLEKLDKKKLQMAEELGLPLGDLLLWAKNVENTQKAIIEALKQLPTEQGIAEQLHTKLMETRNQQAAQMQEKMKTQPQGGGIGLGDLLQLVGGAGGENPLQAQINQLALESLTLGNTFQKVMIAKLAPELADQLLKGAQGVK